MTRDPNFDTLLALDGERFVIDPSGGHWVKFEIKRVTQTNERPHGLKYSLSLHDRKGDRLVGFDNAHSIRSGSGPSKLVTTKHDHKHRFSTVSHYEYINAADLLADFWVEVEAVLAQRGVYL